MPKKKNSINIIRSLAFSLPLLYFTACQEAPTIQSISQSDALKKCELVRKEHVIKFDDNCVKGAFLSEFSTTDMTGKPSQTRISKAKCDCL